MKAEPVNPPHSWHGLNIIHKKDNNQVFRIINIYIRAKTVPGPPDKHTQFQDWAPATSNTFDATD